MVVDKAAIPNANCMTLSLLVSIDFALLISPAVAIRSPSDTQAPAMRICFA